MPLRTVRELDPDESLTLRCDACHIERIWTRAELRQAVGAGTVLRDIGLHWRFACHQCGLPPSSLRFSWQDDAVPHRQRAGNGKGPARHTAGRG